jgi:hypothetical protein
MATLGDKWVLLDPTVPATRADVLTPRLSTLDGKTLGVIWNGRLEGDVILEETVQILRRKYAIKEVIFRKKPYISNVAPPEVFDEFASKCDAVITGVGD